jgi:UDP-N-acetylglucosamine 2-epimerase (non-hydrolysing)
MRRLLAKHTRRRKTVMVVFGTRPEAIKLAPVIERLEAEQDLDVMTVLTGQHREIVHQMLPLLGIEPALDLELMRPNQNLSELAGRALCALAPVLAEHKPDAMIVQGDTTTAFVAGMAAFHEQIPVAHVEAGLRTDNPLSPFPEEVNRRLVGVLARWHFAPTAAAAANLLREQVPLGSITVAGNTAVDSVLAIAERPPSAEVRARLPERRAPKRILVTMHRRETQGEEQRALCSMLADLAHSRDVEVVFPMHMNPRVRASVEGELSGHPRVHLMEPADYVTFVQLLRSADIVATDSGGVQEEAPALDIPVLVMRDTTERPEGVAAGCSRLCGTDPKLVRSAIEELLDDRELYARMAEAPNPYGDGCAAVRIVDRLAEDLLERRSDDSLETTLETARARAGALELAPIPEGGDLAAIEESIAIEKSGLPRETLEPVPDGARMSALRATATPTPSGNLLGAYQRPDGSRGLYLR